MGQSATEAQPLKDGRAGKVKLTDGTRLTGRFVSFGGWLHGEVTVSRGVQETDDGAVRVVEMARRSWPLEQVARVEWA